MAKYIVHLKCISWKLRCQVCSEGQLADCSTQVLGSKAVDDERTGYIGIPGQPNDLLLLDYVIKTYSLSTRVKLRQRAGFIDVGHRLDLTTGAQIRVCKAPSLSTDVVHLTGTETVQERHCCHVAQWCSPWTRQEKNFWPHDLTWSGGLWPGDQTRLVW